MHLNFPKCHLFEHLSYQQLTELYSICEIQRYCANEIIYKEGSLSDSFSVILEGAVSVLKNESDTKVVSIPTLGEIGFMGAIEESPRSATVLTQQDTVLANIKVEAMKNLPCNKYGLLLKALRDKHTDIMSSQLRSTTNLATEHIVRAQESEKQRIIFASVFISTVYILTAYSILLRIGVTQLHFNPSFITDLVLVVGLMILLANIYHIPAPFSHFGINLKNWKKDLIKSLRWTAYALLFLTLLKVVYVHFYGGTVFSFPRIVVSSPVFAYMIPFLYIIGSFVQEFIIRGVLQTSLMHFLQGRYKNFNAVLLSSMLFSMVHLHSPDLLFPALVFIPSLFWGVMYINQESLIGVWVSHSLIGLISIFVIGIPGLT